MKGSQNVSNTPIPPADFMSGPLGSELGGTLLSEDEEEEEEERYAMVSKNLCGFEYTPGHSMDGLEAAGRFSQEVKLHTSSVSHLHTPPSHQGGTAKHLRPNDTKTKAEKQTGID